MSALTVKVAAGCFAVVSAMQNSFVTCVTYAAHTKDTNWPERKAWPWRHYGKKWEFGRNMEDEERLQGRAWEGDCGRWVHEEPEGEGGGVPQACCHGNR